MSRIEKSNIETLKNVSSTKSFNNTPCWVSDQVVIRSSLRDRFQFLGLLVPGSYFSLPLVTKSLVDLFLTFPIFVDLSPIVFTVLSSVISDVFLVLAGILFC